MLPAVLSLAAHPDSAKAEKAIIRRCLIPALRFGNRLGSLIFPLFDQINNVANIPKALSNPSRHSGLHRVGSKPGEGSYSVSGCCDGIGIEPFTGLR